MSRSFFTRTTPQPRRRLARLEPRGPAPYCDCCRKLWSATEELAGMCATCRHQVDGRESMVEGQKLTPDT